MTNIIIRPKTHEEWLLHRNSGIGSSEVATILGLNPFETPYQLWRRKRGMDAPIGENFAMRAGHYLEDAVSRFYSDATGREIIKSSAGDWIIADKTRPYLRVSPDRTYWLDGMPHNRQNKGIVECKTTQMHIDVDNVPQHWFCQLQYQLGVSGYPCGSIAWLTAGREFGYIDIDFDKDFFAYLVDAVDEFWKTNVLGGVEPVSYNSSDVLLRYPKQTSGKEVIADQVLYEQIRELTSTKDEISRLSGIKTALEEKIKLTMGDAEMMTYEGKTLCTWRAGKDTQKLDEEMLKHQYPDIYKSCVKSQPGVRRFTIKSAAV